MKALLDSHTLIWMASDPDQLSKKASTIILNPKVELYVSMATFWELAIKTSIGKLELDGITLDDLRAYALDNDISILSISYKHCKHVNDLPFHHRDLFDRLMISQAQLEGLSFITHDGLITKYDIDVIW